MSHQPIVKGNRLALMGVFWYLLEFAAVALFFEGLPPSGSSAADNAAYYAANHATLPLYVVGVCAAILGRLAFTSGLRCAFHQFAESAPLLDLAYAASVVSVTVETVGLGMIVMALSMAGSGMENASLFAAVFQTATAPFQSLVSLSFVPTAITGAWAVMRTRALPAWLGWVGLIGGVGHLLSVNAGYYPASLMDARELLEFFGWLLMVVWMLATGIVLFRRAGSTR